MRHSFFTVAFAFVAVLFCAQMLEAQSGWDKYTPPEGEHKIDRGPGVYLSALKLIFVIPVFLFWVKIADWISRDADVISDTTSIKGELWNPLTVGVFIFGLLCVLFVPIFLVGYPIYFLCAVIPFIAYVVVRNGAVLDDEEKVFTQRHLAYKWKTRKLEPGEEYDEPMAKLAQDEGAQVTFKAAGPDATTKQRNLISARQNPAYQSLKALLTDAETRRCESIKLDYTRDAVGCHFQIDGTWYAMPPMDRGTGDQMLIVLKTLGNLNPADRRSQQQAEIQYELPDSAKRCLLKTQGTQTGEAVVLNLFDKKAKSWSLEDLGMRPAMQARLKEITNQPGYGIVSAMPAGGLSTTWTGVLNSIDRVMREFIGFIEPGNIEREIENITFHEVTAAAFAETFRGLMLKQPDAVVCPNPYSGEAINLMCGIVNDPNEPKFVISHIRARSATEALLRMLNYKCDRNEFGKAVTFVLNQRLARRLCDSCKQPLQHNPQLMQKLGIPPSKNPPTLYGPYQAPPPGTMVDDKGNPVEPPVCKDCSGLGHRGRIAIFELLEVNDLIRKTLMTQPKLDTLNAAARKSKHRGIQEEGILLLAQGIISLQELQNVVKQ